MGMGNSSDAKHAPKSCDNAASNDSTSCSSSKPCPAPEEDSTAPSSEPNPPNRRRMFRFKSRKEVQREQLRKSLTYFASLAPDGEGKADADNTQHSEEAQLSWAGLWRDIANKGTVGPEDKDALLACERWRRSASGERHDAWYKILSKFRHPYWQRLTTSIRSGVPSVIRGVVWYACSGAAVKKKETMQQYAAFVVDAQTLEDSEAAKVIENDLPRTGVDGARILQLRNILYAFAAKNPQIGYCQSMNFIAATLLLYATEEQAFWMLCSLIEDLLPEGYYTTNMLGLRTDLKVFESLIAQYLPELHKHFEENCIDLSPITMNWFLCLFVNTLPPDSSHNVLDCLLHEGSKVLFRTALSILRIRETELLNAPSVMDAYFLLRVPFGSEKTGLDLHAPAAASADLLASIYGPWLRGFSNDTLSKLRKEHGAVIHAEDEAREARRKEFMAKKAEAEIATDKSFEVAAEQEELNEVDKVCSDLRRESAFFLNQSSTNPATTSFGYLGRAVDTSPQAAATWLSTVIGQNVEEEEEDLKSFE